MSILKNYQNKNYTHGQIVYKEGSFERITRELLINDNIKSKHVYKILGEYKDGICVAPVY